ncbi:unnamed protein product [Miscanthus lutarioriparius]|uniref:Uncharacterized protein n=1 Tax=Miscanthus lutarioriparius TaxID=422564 RepID=A0A811NEB5_9POAL|nr:unnamed protein product [Miscanthus lutarioriparius]
MARGVQLKQEQLLPEHRRGKRGHHVADFTGRGGIKAPGAVTMAGFLNTIFNGKRAQSVVQSVSQVHQSLLDCVSSEGWSC